MKDERTPRSKEFPGFKAFDPWPRILIAFISTWASLVQAQFTCVTNNNELTITGYTGPGGDVSIPDSINGLPVTGIATKACWFNANIVNLTITNAGITVGEMAFYRCSVLTTVNLGPGVTNIGNSAFAYNTTLLSINLDGLNAYYSSAGGVLFDESKTTLLQCPGGLAGSYTAPATVTTIGTNAFLYSTAITSVTLPDAVTNIQDSAFSNCGMTNIALGTNVAVIGNSAFLQSGLRSISLPAGVTNIGATPFIFCNSLPGISVDPLNPAYASVDGVLLDKPPRNVLECPPAKTGSFTIPATVTNIGTRAFYGSHLTNVIVPNGVLTISDYGFSACAMRSIELPDSLLSIGPFAFDPGNLTNVVIGNGLTNIADYGFGDCYYLNRVCFRGNAPVAGPNVFYLGIFTGRNPAVYYSPSTTGWGATYGGLPTVPWDPVSQCTFSNWNSSFIVIGYIGSSNKLNVPGSVAGLPVIAIGDSAFYQNATITNVSLPASVTKIGGSSFANCTALRGINLAGVTNIGGSAFAGCANLTDISFNPGLVSLGIAGFGGCSSLRSIVVPAGVTLLYQTFSGCTNLTSIYFTGNAPSTVSPFVNDTNLTVYYLPGKSGWSSTFGGRPAMLWNPMAGNATMQANQFSFTITGSSNITIVIEACSTLLNPVWTPVGTSTLTGGSTVFSDLGATNFSARYYRFRSP